MGRAFIPGGPSRYLHQRQALAKLIQTRGVGALLMEPGTGKTGVVLDYASLLALKSQTGEARVLVVAPLAAVDTWVLQARTFISPQVSFWAEALGGTLRQRAEVLAARGGRPFATQRRRAQEHVRSSGHRRSIDLATRPEIDADEGPDALPTPRVVLTVLNYDTFSSRAQVGSKTMADLMVEAVRRYRPDLVVADESHKLKSPSSNVSRLMARIGENVPRRAILTGTVLAHSPLDAFAQWRFLQPHAFGAPDGAGGRRRASFGYFKTRFARLGGYMGREIVGFKNLDEMQQIMAENAFVATKDTALDLPPITDTVVPVHLTSREVKAYREMKQQLAAQLDDGTLATVPNRLAQMMRLRQITAGHLPDASGTTLTLGHSKVDTIASLVHDTLVDESRIVVFAVFRAEIDALADRLTRRGSTVLVITGDTPSAERQRMRQRFGSDDPGRLILIAQVRTVSLAVNELVTASHAIFASLSLQRDDIVQARDRLHRIGQSRPSTFWYALAPGTVDEVIYGSYLDRSDLESAVIRHIREESA